MTTRKASRTKLPEFDKYYYYKKAVQAPDNDVVFLRDTYKELRGKTPVVLREDFCGTFSICCEWVKLGPQYRAHGVDLDPEPIEYGRTHYLPELTPPQAARIEFHLKNVQDPGLPKADLICAMNFSHYIFKDRASMKAYFKNCLSTLSPGGVLITDCFGGSLCHEANEEETAHRGFSYFWDQASFDPVTNYALFHIHFKRKGERKREKCFTYDWRMWTIPELREMMAEVGFKKTHVYWEGTTRSGAGDGVFTRTETGEECQSYIAYVVGEK